MTLNQPNVESFSRDMGWNYHNSVSFSSLEFSSLNISNYQAHSRSCLSIYDALDWHPFDQSLDAIRNSLIFVESFCASEAMSTKKISFDRWMDELKRQTNLQHLLKLQIVHLTYRKNFAYEISKMITIALRRDVSSISMKNSFYL